MAKRWSRSTASVVCGAATVAAASTTLMTLAGYFAEEAADPVADGVDLAGVLLLAVCLVPLAAGPWTLARSKPLAAIGSSAASVAALLPFWSAWEPLPASVRAGVLAPPALAALGLAAAVSSTGPQARFDRRLAAVGALAVAASAVHLAGYNPFGDVGCARICVDVAPPGEVWLATRTAVEGAAVLGTAACLAGLWPVLRPADRPATQVRVLAGVVPLCVLGVGLGARLWNPYSADVAAAGAVVMLLSVALSAGALCLDRLRVARARDAVSRLVRDLSGAGTQAVYFAMPERDGWVDMGGRDVDLAALPELALIIPDITGPAIALRLPPHTDPSEVAAGLSPGTRLALTNARLFAVAQRRLAELRAAQRRVVAAADAERRRIGRDLHDGAQQRLISAALHLRIGRPTADRSAHPQFDDAEEQIRMALAALRQLAHGLEPANLIDEGLEAALRELCASSDVPTELDVRCSSDPPTETALAVFTLVAAALGCASAVEPARISVLEQDGALTVRVAMSAQARDLDECLSDAADRIGAAGGDVKLMDAGRPAVAVEAVVPCA